MKYRTMIEIVCEASDKEEAYNTAGEYLRNKIDSGVQMSCKTEPLWAHKAVKYSLSSVLMIMLFAAFLLRVTPISGEAKSGTGICASNTYTIMPELKTKHTADFKKEWENKKEEAVLEFIKK